MITMSDPNITPSNEDLKRMIEGMRKAFLILVDNLVNTEDKLNGVLGNLSEILFEIKGIPIPKEEEVEELPRGNLIMYV